MAKPTEKQIRALETAHKLQFVRLVNAANYWSNLSKKYSVLPVDAPQKIALKQFTATLQKLIGKWHLRQKELEKGGVPLIPINTNTFFRDADRAKLNDLVLKMDVNNKGMGFVPLLIWGIISLAGFFTAAYITDEIVETDKEKKELLLATSDVATKLGLTPEQAQQLIDKQTAPKEGIFDMLFSWKGAAVVGGYLYLTKPDLFKINR